jgi:hypothetical protein
MARLFITHGGKKYEQRFSHGVPQFIDQHGRVVAGSTGKALEEAMRPKKSPSTRANTTMDLTESSSLMRESAELRYRALRKRQFGSTAISESARARRRELCMLGGMSFSEAAIAAHGRRERG